MILPGNGPTLQRGGIEGEKQFSFSLTAKMYDLVSTNLYSDRIGSTVREVCSNAWDGHKAAGKEDKPFKVTLPTNLEPHFIVEDFGTGMTDEKAQELYSTLGLSTKEMTNDMIGAFGLGSKSPFTVTDTFTVENVYNGTQYHYLVFKNEKGFPSILKTGENPTDKDNGVKVIIPVAGTKYHDYANAMKRQLIMMEPKPIITNGSQFSFVDVEKRMEHPEGFVIENASDFGLASRGIYAKMGIVLYPIDVLQLYLSELYHSKFSFRSCLVLNFNIGELDPLPSREGLTYDNAGRTVSIIKAKYEAFKEHIVKEGTAQILAEPTLRKAYNKAKQLSDTFGISEFRNLNYNGFLLNVNPIDFNEKFKYTVDIPPLLEIGTGKELRPASKEDRTDKRWKYDNTYRNYRAIKTDKSNNFDRISTESLNSYDDMMADRSGIDRPKTIVVLMDEKEPKRKTARIRHFERSVFGSPDDTSYGGYYGKDRHNIFWVYTSEHYTGDRYNFDDFIAKFDAVEKGTFTDKFIKFSTIQAPKQKRDAQNKEEYKGVDYMYPKGSYFREMKRAQEYDVDEVCYVTAERNTLDNYSTLDIKTLTGFLYDAGLGCILIRRSGAKFEKEFKEDGVLELKEFINNMMKNTKFSTDFLNSTAVNDISTQYYQYFSEGYIFALENLVKPIIKNGTGRSFIDNILSVQSLKKLIDNDEIDLSFEEEVVTALKRHNLMHYFENEDWVKKLETNFYQKFKDSKVEFYKNFPLFGKLYATHTYAYSDKFKTEIKNYINDMQELNQFRNKIVVQPY